MIRLDLLKNHQASISNLAIIWRKELGSIWIPELSKEYIEQLIGSWINDISLPVGYIALKNNEIVGIASLQENCGIRPKLGPWLGSLVIDSNHQNQGIGTMLINATKAKAKKMGFKELYLFTFDPLLISYYHRLGWTEVGMDKFYEKPVTIMKINV